MRWVVERQFCLFLLPQHPVYPAVFYLLTEHHRCIIPNRFSNVNGCSVHWGQWIGSPSSVFCILLLWQPAPLILLFCSICAVLEKSRKLRTRTGKFWRSFKQKTTEFKSWSRYCESFTQLKLHPSHRCTDMHVVSETFVSPFLMSISDCLIDLLGWQLMMKPCC